jgi:flavin-dependent dehydrogenase
LWKTCISFVEFTNAAFIDPFFSSGIHLAFTSALSAAATICAVINGDCDEASAADWHTKRFATSYTSLKGVLGLTARQNVNFLVRYHAEEY